MTMQVERMIPVIEIVLTIHVMRCVCLDGKRKGIDLQRVYRRLEWNLLSRQVGRRSQHLSPQPRNPEGPSAQLGASTLQTEGTSSRGDVQLE